MRLSAPSVLIHGPTSPGTGDAGDARLHPHVPEDLEQLFGKVAVNTPVTIVNQPFKVGWLGEDLYLEVHIARTTIRARTAIQGNRAWVCSERGGGLRGLGGRAQARTRTPASRCWWEAGAAQPTGFTWTWSSDTCVDAIGVRVAAGLGGIGLVQRLLGHGLGLLDLGGGGAATEDAASEWRRRSGKRA